VADVDPACVGWRSRPNSQSRASSSPLAFPFVDGPLRHWLATAYVQGGPPLALPGELSLDVGRQLAPLMKMEQSTRAILTIGPRFAPDASKSIVAADYAQGLQNLTQRGYLVASGSFCRTAQEILAKCANPVSSVCLTADRERALLQASSTSLEKDIADALRVALK
jgi:hypothetical protein